jgi:hypothetical protein
MRHSRMKNQPPAACAGQTKRNSGEIMKKRGKVVRDTSVGTGLLSIEGQQYPFELEGMWRSDLAPRVNMTVEVEFNDQQHIVAVQTVPESQLAREQAEVAMRNAKEQGLRLSQGMVARFGIDTLTATALLVCGWFVFDTMSVQIAAGYGMGLSFWKILGIVNSPLGVMSALGGSGGGAGMYGLLAIVALAGPLVPFFWNDRRAHLGGLLPLLFMLLIAGCIYFGISDSVKQAQGAALAVGGSEAAGMAAEMASGMAREAMRAISIGLGGYLSVIASLYFAGRGAIKFLAAKA